MKKDALRKMLYLMGVLMLAAMVMVSCKKDDDDDDDPPILVEDGIYVAGPATGLDGLVLTGMMDAGREEGDGFSSNPRNGMFEKFMYLKAGAFNIVEKAGATENKYGWKAGTQEVINKGGEGDEIDGDIHTGEFQANGVDFNAPSDGFYHIVLDKTSGKLWYTKINQWAVIGDATDLGWSGEIAMASKSLSATAAEWEVTGVTLRERGGFKFRYNTGWKITTDDFIIFANIGQDGNTGNFINGGGGFPYPTAGEGAYTITLKWSIADGWSYTTVRTGDVEPLPEYPEELFMIGDGVGNWSWDETDLPMIPTAGNKDHLFWKIVWMNAEGGFKFAPQKDWIGDFGKTGDATDGIYEIGGENLPVPGVAGYYMVVVNLETDEIAIDDAKVYLIGNTIGNWDTANPEALFTVDNDNEVITITKDLAADELRMYAWFDKGWFTDWWQHEFMILSGQIEFRGRGDDQERVNIDPAGEYKIDLNFKTGAGSITAQ